MDCCTDFLDKYYFGKRLKLKLGLYLANMVEKQSYFRTEWKNCIEIKRVEKNFLSKLYCIALD